MSTAEKLKEIISEGPRPLCSCEYLACFLSDVFIIHSFIDYLCFRQKNIILGSLVKCDKTLMQISPKTLN